MKEWYLIGNGTKPNMLGGYENQSFINYKEDAFTETLETDMATTVLLYNSDLSIQKEIRCIIEGNVADTQLQSMQRKGLFVRGTVKDGMYIFFEGGYWLIIGFPGTNGIYEKATMSLCQFKLRWQNSEGKIIERWAYTEDFTKYSNGTTGNNVLTIGDNQYGLTIPIDDETKKLKRDMRFSIDFDDSEQPDVYRLTNRKAVLNDNSLSNHGGTMIITMSFDAFNSSEDKKVVMEDGQEVWICNYNNISDVSQNPNETNSVRAKILGEDNIKLGFYRTYTVEFKNNNGLVDWNNVNFRWDIACAFDSDKIISERNNNNIRLYVEDKDLFDEKIKIRIVIDDNIITEKILHIK